VTKGGRGEQVGFQPLSPSATKALPGPQMKSTLGIVCVPSAIPAIAWTPPNEKAFGNQNDGAL
jgi:hypothetical protein